MANIKLFYPNLSDRAEYSGGGWDAGQLSLEALHDPVISHVARSVNTDPANTRITIALDRPRDIRGFAIVNHNLSTAARYIVEAASDAGFTTIVYNAEGIPQDAYPALFRTRDLPWSNPNWFSGRPLAEDIAAVTSAAILVLPVDINARYWRIRILDENNAAGFVQIGRLFFGPVWEPAINYSYNGNRLGVDDLSNAQQSIGGTLYFDKRPRRRTFAFSFDRLEEDAHFAVLFDMIRSAGVTEEIFVVPDSDDSLNLQRRSFLARMRQASAIDQVPVRHIATSFVLEELI